jgi:hypothetical protein
MVKASLAARSAISALLLVLSVISETELDSSWIVADCSVAFCARICEPLEICFADDTKVWLMFSISSTSAASSFCVFFSVWEQLRAGSLLAAGSPVGHRIPGKKKPR